MSPGPPGIPNTGGSRACIGPPRHLPSSTESALEDAFRALGFEPCGDDGPEPGFKKVALFGNSLFYTHAARQLPGGKWTSKLGKAEDIEHDTPDAVAGGVYGEIVVVMRRRSGFVS